MTKAIQHFLFGFSSVLDIFKPVEELKLSRGGFSEDQQKLRGDVKKISKDFVKVVNNGKRKDSLNRQK
jgi:hypothetical protein